MKPITKRDHGDIARSKSRLSLCDVNRWHRAMDLGSIIRTCIIFLVLATTLASNMEDNLLARLGMDANVGYALGLAVLISILLSERHAFVVAAVVIFSLNANMPLDFSLNMGLDRDYFAGVMFALLLQPIVVRTMELG